MAEADLAEGFEGGWAEEVAVDDEEVGKAWQAELFEEGILGAAEDGIGAEGGQLVAEGGARVGVIFGDDDVDGWELGACGSRGFGDGDGEMELGAVGGGGFDVDGAAHEFDQALADGESEAGTAETAGGGGVGLGERHEEAGDLFLGHADAGITDGKAEVGLSGDGMRALDIEDDLAVLGELDGVANEVEEDLPETAGVGADARGDVGVEVDDELDALLDGLLGEEVHDAFDDGVEVELLGEDLDLGGLDLGEVEDVLDDAHEGFAGGADGLNHFLLVGGEVGVEEERRHADDPVHGGPDLVAHGGEELGFGAVGGLGLFLGAVEFEFGLPAFGEVGDGGDGADDAAIAAVGDTGDEGVGGGAVAAAEADLVGGGFLALSGFAGLLEDGNVLGEDELAGAVSYDPGFREADEACEGFVGEGEHALLVADGEALAHEVHDLEGEVALAFDLGLGLLALDELADLVAEGDEELEEILVGVVGVAGEEFDDAEEFAFGAARERKGALEAALGCGGATGAVLKGGEVGDPEGAAFGPDASGEPFAGAHPEVLGGAEELGELAIGADPEGFGAEGGTVVGGRPEDGGGPTEGGGDGLEASGDAGGDGGGFGEGAGDLVLEGATMVAADAFGDVAFEGHVVADLALGVADGLDLEVEPVLLAGLVVVEDLEVDGLTVAEAFTDDGDGSGIRFRSLEEVAGFAAGRFVEGVAGQAGEAGVDPFDQSAAIADDDGLVGAVGDEGEFVGDGSLGAELFLGEAQGGVLFLEPAVGGRQFGALVAEAFGEFLQVRDGGLLGLDALEEVEGGIMDGEVVEKEAELAEGADVREPGGTEEDDAALVEGNDLAAQEDLGACDLDEEEELVELAEGLDGMRWRDLGFAEDQDLIEGRAPDEIGAEAEEGGSGLGYPAGGVAGEVEREGNGELFRRQTHLAREEGGLGWGLHVVPF